MPIDAKPLSHKEAVELYKETVKNAAPEGMSVVFLDTDKILSLPANERTEEVAKEIKEQSPELFNKLIEMGGKSLEDNIFIKDMAHSPKDLTASAHKWSDPALNDFGFVTLPSSQKDTRNEFLPAQDGITDLQINKDAMRGTSRDMIMFNAAHEAFHLHQSAEQLKASKNDPAIAKLNEAQADVFAKNYVNANGGTPGFTEDWEMVRAIVGILHPHDADEGHAVTGLTDKMPTQVTQQDINEAVATRTIMDDYVGKKVNMEGLGMAVLLEDPQKYAKIVQDGLKNGDFNNFTESQRQKIDILSKAIDKFFTKPETQEEAPIVTPDGVTMHKDLESTGLTAQTFIIADQSGLNGGTLPAAQQQMQDLQLQQQQAAIPQQTLSSLSISSPS